MHLYSASVRLRTARYFTGIECRQPRPITFGRIEPAPAPGSKYYFNDEVRYFCDSGYSLIGSSRAVCQLDGTYSAPTPRCDGTCTNLHNFVHMCYAWIFSFIF